MTRIGFRPEKRHCDIQMFHIKYLTMDKIHMHAGAIRKLLYGLCVCTEDNPLAKAPGLSSHTYAQTIQQLTLNGILYFLSKISQFMKVWH